MRKEIAKLITTLEKDPNATELKYPTVKYGAVIAGIRVMVNPILKKYQKLYNDGEISMEEWCAIFQTIVYGQRPIPSFAPIKQDWQV